MKKQNKKALTCSAIGVALVITSAFLTNLLAPKNTLGESLRFLIPLLTGLISGATIFLKLNGPDPELLEELKPENRNKASE